MRYPLAPLFVMLFFAGYLHAAQIPNIVVFPLKSVGVSPGTAEVVTDRIRTSLGKSGKARVLERNELDNILKTIGANLDDCTEEGCGIEIGRQLDADKIVTGSITRVGRRTTISVNLVDLETTERQIPASKDVDNAPEERLIDLVPDLVDQIVTRIPITGKILNVDGGRILVDIGSKNGVKMGDDLEVEQVKELLDPDTHDIKQVPQKVGVLRVVEGAGNEFSQCRPVTGENFAVGMRVATKMVTYETKIQQSRDSQAHAGAFMAPGFGQMRTDQQRGWVYMGGFVAGAALGTMNFLKYRQATDDYDATLAAYYQNPSTASYSKLTAASDDKTKYQQQTQILFGAAVGFYVWGIVDAFIWGGGEADGISLLDRPNRRIELVAAPGRVGVGVRF